jgi:RND superfamily putative drug exporter
MLLVPATMELLGARNWWMPRWLDRLLPHLNVEGASQEQPSREQRDEREHPPVPVPVLAADREPVDA